MSSDAWTKEQMDGKPLHIYKQATDAWGIYQARATKKRHRAEDAALYTV